MLLITGLERTVLYNISSSLLENNYWSFGVSSEQTSLDNIREQGIRYHLTPLLYNTTIMKESSLESDEVKRDRTVQNSKGNSMAVAMSTRQVPIPIRSDRALQEVTSGGTGHQHQTSQHIPAAAPMSMPLPRQSTAGKSSDSSLEEEESQISRGVPRTGQAGGLPPVKKSGVPKKDRSKLRKGKWTVSFYRGWMCLLY
jgi:hypothetical protein